jgi:phosphoribosylformylglycinamidine synthase PurS subunit
MRAKITVMPRRDVLDTQGDSVKSALVELGYEEVTGVKVGRYIEVDVRGTAAEARARVKLMCEELLANPIIEDYYFTLESDSGVFPAIREAHSEGAGG